MNVRSGTRADISEIVRVINAAYRVEDFFINGNRTDAEEIDAKMADSSVRIFVVDGTEPNVIAACVIVDVHDRRGHFAMLSVDPPFQGKGLSRVLLNAVEDYCRSAGCDTLDLEIVNLREELPAYYGGMGFAPIDIAPFPDTRKLTREAHLVIMSKPLAPTRS